MHKSKLTYVLSQSIATRALAAIVLLTGCGPKAHIPTRPANIHSAIAADDSAAQLARALAPVLYLQRDEWFRLERVVAVLHPKRPVIGYYLLWRDDVHGAWIPFTKATDEEIVWVGYDSTHAPTDIWTYWHGKIVHADWRGRGTVLIDVQWGKHGSLPRGIVNDDPLWPRTLSYFWVTSWVGAPDIWLSRITRRGPMCFCRGYRRYRAFDRALVSGPAIDFVVRVEDPDPVLGAVFGRPYSKKGPWP